MSNVSFAPLKSDGSANRWAMRFGITGATSSPFFSAYTLISTIIFRGMKVSMLLGVTGSRSCFSIL